METELLLSDILGTEENEVYKDIEEDVERQLVFDAINRLKRRESERLCICVLDFVVRIR